MCKNIKIQLSEVESDIFRENIQNKFESKGLCLVGVLFITHYLKVLIEYVSLNSFFDAY